LANRLYLRNSGGGTIALSVDALPSSDCYDLIPIRSNGPPSKSKSPSKSLSISRRRRATWLMRVEWIGLQSIGVAFSTPSSLFFAFFRLFPSLFQLFSQLFRLSPARMQLCMCLGFGGDGDGLNSSVTMSILMRRRTPNRRSARLASLQKPCERKRDGWSGRGGGSGGGTETGRAALGGRECGAGMSVQSQEKRSKHSPSAKNKARKP